MTVKDKKIKIQVKNLARCRHFVPLVSRWLWRQWAKRHGSKIKDIIYRTEHCLEKKSPQTLIAFYNGQPAGTVSLWNSDHPYRPDLGPWLSCLFVLKKYRSRGIGAALQIELLKTARRAGFKKIYLITDMTGYYEKKAWRLKEVAPYTEGRRIRIYEHKL